MKLLCLNVGLFEANNEKLRTFFKEQQPDIVCLQEVTRRLDDTTNAAFVSKDTIDKSLPTLTENFFAPFSILSNFKQPNFHGKELFEFELGGKVEFGNYVKSKFPIVKGQNIFVQNHFSYMTDWSNWPADDAKSVQIVDFNIGERPLRIINYHGIWSREKMGNELTKQACERILQATKEVQYPSIICGDFNLFPDTESMSVFYQDFVSLVDQFKIKTTRPETNELHDQHRNVIDYILVSKSIRVEKFEVLQSDVSDHLPLVAEFEI